MELDALLLSRLQFALTISFHILFPTLTIGLAVFLAVLEGLWLKTLDQVYHQLYVFWARIFALGFGMGVVSGVVLSYQFGTNFSRFSEVTGNVLGPLMTYEVLTAFFLEAGFLGIMLFGWNRVRPSFHYLATLMVAVGTIVSALWILSANSWMHTPAGVELRDGIFHVTNWMEVVFNPSFPYRFVHMMLAGLITTAFFIAGVSAWYLYKRQHRSFALRTFTLAIAAAAVLTLRAMALMTPAGFLATLAGWYVAEAGRQPWLVQGVLRTAEGVSSLPAEQVFGTLATFATLYTALFAAYVYYLVRTIRRGPDGFSRGAEIKAPARSAFVSTE